MDPLISVIKTGDAGGFMRRISKVGSLATYVGIPSSDSGSRTESHVSKAAKSYSLRKNAVAKRNKLIKKAAINNMTNAGLLFILTRGSMLRNQPPRPVIEPAIQAPWNRKVISALIAQAAIEFAEGRVYKSQQLVARAGAAGAKAAKEWFDDPRNGWPRNATRTIEMKGFDQPGIELGIMRDAITHVEKEI